MGGLVSRDREPSLGPPSTDQLLGAEAGQGLQVGQVPLRGARPHADPSRHLDRPASTDMGVKHVHPASCRVRSASRRPARVGVNTPRSVAMVWRARGVSMSVRRAGPLVATGLQVAAPATRLDRREFGERRQPEWALGWAAAHGALERRIRVGERPSDLEVDSASRTPVVVARHDWTLPPQVVTRPRRGLRQGAPA